MRSVMAELERGSAAEAKEALFASLAARFGGRFSLSAALREQHANTLTWLKLQAPDAVLFAETAEEVSEAVKACAAESSASLPVSYYGAITKSCIDRVSATALRRIAADAESKTMASTATLN